MVTGNPYQINEIVTVINDIARRTNLLALDSAIEAIRVNKQGKSFTAVADEVKKLAASTAGATSKIKDRILEVQNQMARASDALKEPAGVSGQTAGEAAGSPMSSRLELHTLLLHVSAAVERMSAISGMIGKDINI